MAHVVVSNTGMWDPQALGVVGVLKDHRDFRSFCDNRERLENNSVPRSLVDDGTEESLYSPIHRYEMSSYFDGPIVSTILFPEDGNEEDNIIPNMYFMVSL